MFKSDKKEYLNYTEEYLAEQRAVRKAKVFIPFMIVLVVVVSVSLGIMFMRYNCFETISEGCWAVLESSTKDREVVDESGYYYTGFGLGVTRYPKQDTIAFDNTEGGGDTRAKVVFADGGCAYLYSLVRIDLPKKVDDRIRFINLTNNDYSNFEESLRFAVITASKEIAMDFTSIEVLSFRRAEFANSLYERIEKSSVFADYGVTMTQFSLTGTEFDPQTQRFLTKLLEEREKANEDVRLAKREQKAAEHRVMAERLKQEVE